MLSLLLGLAEPPAVQFSVKSVHGLHLTLSGVPIVRGSWFQYYEPDGSKGHYSSSFNHQKIEALPNGDVKMTFKSPDGRAYGSQYYARTEKGIKVTYNFGWNNHKPAKLEFAAAAMWAPALQYGSLFADGMPSRSLLLNGYKSDSAAERAYATGAKQLQFNATLGTVRVKFTGPGWLMYDARRLNEQWAFDRDIFWLGVPDITVKPGEVVKLEADWEFEPKDSAAAEPASVTLPVQSMSDAVAPPAPNKILIPRPKQILFKHDDPFVLGKDLSLDLPARLSHYQQEFVGMVERLWDVPDLTFNPNKARIFTRIQNLGLPAEGYEISINHKTAFVMGQDEAGLRHALRTLAQLVYAQNGKLSLPSGSIRDWPTMKWRGVHLFAGNESLPFHDKMWERVLAPLKFNKVVVQCERADWKSLPGIATPLSTSREELKRLFDMYRRMGIDPIPLIQSFGHMEWLFANGKNLDIASHKEIAYSVNVRDERTREVLDAVWEEAITLLKPQTVHFGLDEVDLRGGKEDPGLISNLWEVHLPYLGTIAGKHHVDMMLWGDKALAPGEAIDAAHGDSQLHAKRRRRAIPAGSYIADWHYKNDPNPERFQRSLALWKNEGFKPIASTWFRPENIRGFYLAAAREGAAGTLQTTWAGHYSNEAGMLREYRQFAAMVVAADYAWSGRDTAWDQLEYSPEEVFGKMFYAFRREPSNVKGTALANSWGNSKRIGDYNFRTLAEPLALSSLISQRSSTRPTEHVIKPEGNAVGRHIGVAIDTIVRCEENDPVAEIEVEYGDGKKSTHLLLYGRHVRSGDDPKAIPFGTKQNGLTALPLTIATQPVPIKSVRLRASSTYAGLRLHGLTVF